MKKYIDADRLREKLIERLGLFEGLSSDTISPIRIDECKKIIGIIDSLQQEQPSERFEKELAKVIVEVVDNKDGEGPSLKEYAKRLFASAHSVPFVLEQPDVDLEKEIVRFLSNSTKMNKGEWRGKYAISDIGFRAVARHFYEIGLNARKEEQL